VKIVDFGIAKTESKLNRTQAGVLKGKFGYMSPEQAAGLELDLRTDIFFRGHPSLRDVHGAPALSGDNDFETLEKIKECNIPPPTKYNPALTPEIEQLVMKRCRRKRKTASAAPRRCRSLSRASFTRSIRSSPARIGRHSSETSFAQEIESEQESLRRAIDALPAEELAAAASAAEAANDRIVESGSRRMPSRVAFPPSPSRPSRVGIPAAGMPSSPRASNWRAFFSRLVVLVVSVTVGGFLAWRWLVPTPPGPSASPTPTPAATAGNPIQITSDPAGAALFIDDKPRGPTPALLRLEPKKVYLLRIEKDGFKAFTERLLVTEDQASYGPYRLEPDLRRRFTARGQRPPGSPDFDRPDTHDPADSGHAGKRDA